MKTYMKIDLQLHEKHLERINTFKPINALKEMIWNSYDADANNIIVEIKRNEYDLLQHPIVSDVIVTDDGTGLAYEATNLAFKNFGFSSKSNGNKKSPSGRRMHGSKGEGRYSLFSIGRNIHWFSAYFNSTENMAFSISFDSTNHGKTINISDEARTAERTGLKITVDSITQEAKDDLEKTDSIIQELLKEFASCLLAYPNLKITFENRTLNIDENVALKETYTKTIDGQLAEIVAVEWKEKSSSTIFYCDEGGIPIEQEQLKSKHSITIYVSSKLFSEAKSSLILMDGQFIPENLSHIKEFIDDSIDDFEKKIISRNESQFIQSMKDDGVYPIQEEPKNIREKHNKAVFDTIVVEINKTVPAIRTRGKKEQKLLNNLLFETVKNNPGSLTTIMSKVVDLSKDDQDRFARLLTKIELSQIIKTIDSVLERIKFLEMLNDMIYTDIGKGIKERTEFQRILKSQLWIFGEQYTFSSIDRSVKNVLAQYVNIFGRTDIEFGPLENGELIPDICLFSTKAYGDNALEHLVVEIKRPTKTLSLTEMNQIITYASTISTQPQFNNNGHKWTFVLLGKAFDSTLQDYMSQKSDGIISQNLHSVVKVLQWEEIIRKTKRQYKYFKDQLEIDFKNQEIVDGINEQLDDVRDKH